MDRVFRIEGEIEPGLANEVSRHLEAYPEGAEIILNSGGGSATEGAAVNAELRKHGAVTLSIFGIAASSASMIAMGAKTVLMDRAALLMLHEPWAVTIGPADPHRASAAVLDKLSSLYGSVYSRASGHSQATILAWMKAETWLTADEALELNFVDAVIGDETSEVKPSACAYGRFKAAPPDLVAMAKQHGWDRTGGGVAAAIPPIWRTHAASFAAHARGAF